MNICPKCGNEQVNKFYIVGIKAEDGEKFCDQCIGSKNESLLGTLKKLIKRGKNK